MTLLKQHTGITEKRRSDNSNCKVLFGIKIEQKWKIQKNGKKSKSSEKTN